MLFDIGFYAGDSKCPGRFRDTSGIQKDVLDGGAHIIRIDKNDFVHIFPGKPEGFFSNQLDCRSVGEKTDIRQVDTFAGIETLFHGTGINRFHTDYSDFGTDFLDVCGNTGNQSAASYRHENGMDRPGVLTENFHTDRSLTGNDIRIVKWVDKCQVTFFFKHFRVITGIGKRIAEKNDFNVVASVCPDCFNFDGGRCGWHRDNGLAVQFSGRQGDSLGVIAGGCTNNPLFQLAGGKIGHFVIGAAKLETEDALHVFTF